ncbi:putative sulfate exporter family transporter [uncultured Brevibacterium sp.]|uniref:YeiH family protein n=1 Tax=uncultured Brevibacterium sp. TaxID=189678 RepID=UPI002600F3EC|nr:putative sulfate exporter family transporter [uncultured Brevibacterium sp.]
MPSDPTTLPRSSARIARLRELAPGAGLAALGAAAAVGIGALLPTVSALLVAIVLGMLVRNLATLPPRVEPGLNFAAKHVLRAGIVLLGLQLVLGDILGLGTGVVLTVVAVVAVGFAATLLAGRLLRLSSTQTLLIASGFSICGAAAVAAVDGVNRTEDEEEVVTAVALVVVFGTLMIPALPLAAAALGLTEAQTGLWAGASVHEVAQVVAIGGSLGAAALSAAVLVKLARVLLLAPVMMIIAVRQRRVILAARTSEATRTSDAGTDDAPSLPPLVPLFVLGFLAMVALRSTGIVPLLVVDAAAIAQTALLAAAMFALGTGVRLSIVKRVGARPFALAALSTLAVAATGLTGVLLAA